MLEGPMADITLHLQDLLTMSWTLFSAQTAFQRLTNSLTSPIQIRIRMLHFLEASIRDNSRLDP